MRTDDREVIEAVRGLLDRVRPVAPMYARLGASTLDIAKIAAEAGAEVHYFPFGSTAAGMAYPRVESVIPVFVDSMSTRADQLLSVLHELAHALRGEVEEPTYLTAADTMSPPERVADLFAIIGLAPTRWMQVHVAGRRRTERAMVLDVVQAYRQLTNGWSDRRLWDRARLRVLLYRQHGI